MATGTGVIRALDGSTHTLKVPVALRSTSALFAGDPGPGRIVLGLGHEGGMKLVAGRAAQFAADVGRTAPLYPLCGRIYITPFASIAEGIAKAKAALAEAALVKAWGGLPFIDTKELTSLDFTKVGLGQMDQYLDFLVEGLAVLDWPTILGLHQEPVGDTVGGTLETGTAGAKAYGSALDRVALRRDLAGARKVSTTGCIGFGAFDTPTTGKFGSALPWFQYTAAASTGWGGHHYLQYESQDEAKWLKGWSLDRLFGQFWAMQDTVDSTKARFHGEVGVHTRAANLATAPQFMDELLTYCIAHRVRVCSWFDSGLNSNAGGPWTFDCPIQGGNGTPDPSRRIHFARQLLDKRVAGPSALAA